MSKRERDQQRKIPTQAALEASLPEDPDKLRKLAAQLLVDKAVLEQELSLEKRRQRRGRETDESSENPDR